MDGQLLLIDKPAGWTSHDVVAKLRGIFHIKRIGHAGTLDPFATGLLIVGVGPATKQLTALVGTDKTYLATARLGATSTTDDTEGTITETVGAKPASPSGMNADMPTGMNADMPTGMNADMPTGQGDAGVAPTMTDIESCLHSFLGTHEQISPIFSAKKVGGKKMYELARAGLAHTVETPRKMVTIHSIKILSYTWPELTFEVSCSSGTYIRALARDIGQKLGCGAYLTALRRTRVGDYQIEDATPISKLQQGRNQALTEPPSMV